MVVLNFDFKIDKRASNVKRTFKIKEKSPENESSDFLERRMVITINLN